MSENFRAGAKIIVAAMCEKGFMNGLFGDIGEEFQDEQVGYIMGLSREERGKWVKRNEFNMTTYCGLNPVPRIY